jgi:hypothetical protein
MSAMISSIEETWSWRQRFCMPADSSWKTPVVLPGVEQREGPWVVDRHLLDVEGRVDGAPDVVHGVGDHGQRLQAEEVHLEEPELADGVHVELDRHVALLERERHELLEGPVRDDDARRVLAGVPDHALQHPRLLEDLLRGGIPLDLLAQLGDFATACSSVMLSSSGIIFASRSASA